MFRISNPKLQDYIITDNCKLMQKEHKAQKAMKERTLNRKDVIKPRAIFYDYTNGHFMVKYCQASKNKPKISPSTVKLR